MVSAISAAPSVTLSDVIDSHAFHRGDAVAVVDDATSTSWAQLAQWVSEMADGLAARGVRRGDTVAVAAELSVDYVALYYATARIGAILVPLNWRLSDASVRSMLERTSPALVIVGVERLTSVVGESAGEVLTDTPDATWGERLRAPSATSVSPPSTIVDGDHPHLIIFTSGTTGTPKAAVLSQRSTMVDSYAGALASRLGPTDRLLTYQAPYHGGTWALIRQYLLVGPSVVLTRSFDATRVLGLIEQRRCTSFFAVPLVLKQLVESPDFGEFDLSSLRNVVFASYDPHSQVMPIVEQLRLRGNPALTVEHIYGQTENSSLITTSRPHQGEGGVSSVGRPVPGVRVSLRDGKGHEVGPGEIGEICVRSPSLMQGYLNDPQATADVFRGGWLHTGDLGQLDAGGELSIVGRLKEMIRTAGVNVYPREVAEVLGKHPAVRDCAVFGVPDDRYDERVVAAVVSSESGLTPERLTAWVRERMAGYQTPRQVIFLDALPKTAAGKTATVELVAMALRDMEGAS